MKSRIVRGALLLGVLLLAAFAALPLIIGIPSVSNSLMASALEPAELEGSVGGLSVGWFSPLECRQLEIKRADERLRVSIDDVRFDRSWLQLGLGYPDLGTSIFEKPTVEVVMDQEPPFFPISSQKQQSGQVALTGNIELRDAAIHVGSLGEEREVVRIDDVDLLIQIQDAGQGRMLDIQPTTLLDRVELTEQLFNSGLQLAAPILASNATIAGSASLELTRFHLPLSGNGEEFPPDADIEGILKLHDVTAGVKDSPLEEAAREVATVLGISLPGKLRIIQETEVEFAVKDGHVHHKGLAFFLPELSPDFVWTTEGSVGFDETIDMTIGVKIPTEMVASRPLLKTFLQKPIRITIQGPIEKPAVNLADAKERIRELGTMLMADFASRPENIGALLGNLMPSRRPAGENAEEQAGSGMRIPPGVLKLVGDLMNEPESSENKAALQALMEGLTQENSDEESEQPRGRELASSILKLVQEASQSEEGQGGGDAVLEVLEGLTGGSPDGEVASEAEEGGQTSEGPSAPEISAAVLDILRQASERRADRNKESAETEPEAEPRPRTRLRDLLRRKNREPESPPEVSEPEAEPERRPGLLRRLLNRKRQEPGPPPQPEPEVSPEPPTPDRA